MPIIAIPRLIAQLIGLFILGGAVYLLWQWYDGETIRLADGTLRDVRGPLWQLILGLVGLGLSFGGRSVMLLFMKSGRDEPRVARAAGDTILAPDGGALHVESLGPEGAPTLVFTHGWGLNSTAWWYARQHLSDRFRIVTWDLPGLGRSGRPTDGKYSIDRFAEALGAVVEWSGAERVVLVGHSIGGMTSQTLWRARPDLRGRVAGLVLIDTTHLNPLHTMVLSRLWLALRKPLLEPMAWIMVGLSPLLWLSKWHSYLNGSTQIVMRLLGFGDYATRGQVDFTALLSAKASPAVQAKGDLAMFNWHVTQDLPAITAPTLVLAGDKDIITLPRASREIAAMIPQAQLSIIEGVNHMGFLERALDYDNAIAQFADRAFAIAPQP